MKRFLGIILALILIIAAVPISAYAAETTPTFNYDLSIDGQTEKTVKTGDIITVILKLQRTDANEAYPMYAMQSEIRYDSTFFELVEGGEILSPGIQSTDISARGDYREFYMNFLSFNNGETWNANTLIGSFQLRVIGTSGVSKITNEDFLVSFKDGSGSYECTANALTVIVSTDCTVHFETNGGTPIDNITAIYGEKITKPEDPQKDGKYFAGWYRDIDCTQAWDFENDTVSGNMTLYAKWSDTPVNDTDTTPGTDVDNPQTPKDGSLCWLWWLLLVIIILIIIYIIWKKRSKDKAKKNT